MKDQIEAVTIPDEYTEVWCEDCEKWTPTSEWRVTEAWCETCGGHDFIVHDVDCEGFGMWDSYGSHRPTKDNVR